MVNNYSNEILEQSAKKFLMCSVAGRRWAQPFVEQVSGDLYRMNIAGPNFLGISEEVTGFGPLAWTRVNGTPANQLEYSYDDSTGELLFYRTSMTDLRWRTIISFNWTFTSDLERYQNNNFNTNYNEVIWQARLANKPKFKFSQENSLYGILTIDEVALSVRNMDRFLSPWFTKYDSYRNSDAQVWQCVENQTNYKLMFTGKVKGFSCGEFCTLSIGSKIQQLDSMLYPSTSEGSFVFDNGLVQEKDVGKPFRRIYGNYSPFGLKKEAVGGEIGPNKLDSSTLLEAICVSFNPVIGTSVNRTWHCCIGNAANEIVGTVSGKASGTIVGGVAGLLFTFNTLEEKYLTPGDQIAIFDSTGVTPHYYGTVHENQSGQIACYPQTELVSVSAGDKVKVGAIRSLILLKDGVEYVLRYRRDYTVTTTSEFQDIVLANNFEANFSIGAIDPQNDVLYFKYGNQDSANFKHGTALKDILLNFFDASELNLTSFSDADTDFPFDICFCYPPPGADTFFAARLTVEKFLKSTLGTLYFDDDGLLSYKVLNTPAPVESINDDDFFGQITSSTNYTDTYASVVFRHPDFPFNKGQSQFQASFPLNEVLHLADEILFQEYFLDQISADSNFKNAIFRLARLLADPKKTYSLSTIIKNHESLVTDEFTLDSIDVGGEEDTVIIGIAKGEDETDLTMSDFAKNRSILEYVNDGQEYDEDDNQL